jgi:uncharacterized protein (TIGR02145 family)
MKRICQEYLLVCVTVFVLIASGCKHSLPVVTTSNVTKFTANTAECGGNITFEGKPKFTSYGICWDTKPDPTISNLHTVRTESVPGQFVSTVSGLTADKTYYVKAYATNSAGTAYGEQITFTTTVSVPQLLISNISDITSTSAVCGSIITSTGGSNIISCGICWDTVPNPTVNSAKTTDNLVKTVYISHLSGLNPNKTYYLKAYAVNSVGTGYGEEKRMTTSSSVPALTTNPVSEISLNTATCSMKILSNGGTGITESGICWGTNPDPTTSNSKTSEYYTKGKYRLTGLQVATNYYVRAYAVNSAGTGYGQSVSFRTSGNAPLATTLEASNQTPTGALLKGVVNANSFPTQVYFEYGKTTDYGSTKIIGQTPVTGKADKQVSAELSGLETGITYHFRVKAVNTIGTTYGKDLTFVTLRAPSLSNFRAIHKNYNDKEFTIVPPASNSKGTFSYTSSNTKVATIKNNIVTITGPGITTITATQAPSGTFTTGTISATLTMNLIDNEGNVYNTIAIGNQDWMKENLRSTKYSNGTPIANEQDAKTWGSLTTGAMCWYNNDQANSKTTNGALYNWYAVASPDKLCPAGWHVSTDSDWKEMEMFLGMTVKEVEGTLKRKPGEASKIKDKSGWIKDGKGTNVTDFSAVAAGFRMAQTGAFTNLGLDGCWWTATEDKGNLAWLRNMYFSLSDIYRLSDNKSSGFSVRCVRDK